GESVFSLSNQVVDDGDSFLDVVTLRSRGQRTEDLRGRKSDPSVHRPCKIANLPLSIGSAPEVEEMDELAWAHAHDYVCGCRIRPEISGVLCLDSLRGETFFSLTSQVHHVCKVQLYLVPLNLNWDLEIFGDPGRLEIPITSRDSHISLALLREGCYSMSNDLVTGCSAYSLQVESEASMSEHPILSHLHSSFLQVCSQLRIVGVAE